MDIIINNAASVNFDDPLLDALNINYFGVMRLLELAKVSRKKAIFTHVSTAYVNSNRAGRLEEKVYELDGGKDPEEFLDEILKLNPQQVIEREKDIIGKYPNTYTFTKALTERVLKKRHGDVKITIVRPSIVISTFKEPFLGWTETISALGGLLFATQMGLINYLYCNSTQCLDIVPCDYVSNLVVATTAHTGQTEGPCFEIYHSSSSAQNPVKLYLIVSTLVEYI